MVLVKVGRNNHKAYTVFKSSSIVRITYCISDAVKLMILEVTHYWDYNWKFDFYKKSFSF